MKNKKNIELFKNLIASLFVAVCHSLLYQVCLLFEIGTDLLLVMIVLLEVMTSQIQVTNLLLEVMTLLFEVVIALFVPVLSQYNNL